MTFEEKAEVVISQLRADRDRLQNIIEQIRAEIEKQEKWLMDVGYNAYNVDIALSTIKSVLAESEGCDIKFRVGDIVILNRDVSGYKNVKGSKGIIEKIAFDYEIKEERAFVNCGKGFVGWIRLKYLTNTGKHYPLINEILGEIQGEE
jgi:hypothetical protein